MQISIILTNLRGNTKILLDDEKKSCTVNGIEKNVNVDKVASRLLRIVSSWEDSYINPLIIDGLTYEVKIIKDGKTYTYYGSNDFPKNFHQFTALINEVMND